jgi:hypothetical protein
VSYVSSDRHLVLPIVERLQAAGVRVWIDFISIPPGANYGLEISKAIQACSALVLAITPAALQSRNVKQEIQLGWKHHRPYLPLLIEPTTLPPEIEYWLEGYQWIQIHDRSEAEWLPRMIGALQQAGVLESGAAGPTATAPLAAAPSAAAGATPQQGTAGTPRPAGGSSGASVAAAGPAARPSRFLIPAMAGAGVLAAAIAVLMILAPWRGDGVGSTPAAAAPNTTSASRPADASGAGSFTGSTGSTQPVAPAGLTKPGSTEGAAGAPAAEAPKEQDQNVRIMPMGS